MNTTKMLELTNCGLAEPEQALRYLSELKKMIVDDINSKKRKAAGKKELCRAFEKVQKHSKKLHTGNRLALQDIIQDGDKTAVTDGYRMIISEDISDLLNTVPKKPGYHFDCLKFASDYAAADDEHIKVTLPQPAELAESIQAFKKMNKYHRSGYPFPEIAGSPRECTVNPEWLKEAIDAGITELEYVPKHFVFIGTDAKKSFTYIILGIKARV